MLQRPARRCTQGSTSCPWRPSTRRTAGAPARVIERLRRRRKGTGDDGRRASEARRGTGPSPGGRRAGPGQRPVAARRADRHQAGSASGAALLRSGLHTDATSAAPSLPRGLAQGASGELSDEVPAALGGGAASVSCSRFGRRRCGPSGKGPRVEAARSRRAEPSSLLHAPRRRSDRRSGVIRGSGKRAQGPQASRADHWHDGTAG